VDYVRAGRYRALLHIESGRVVSGSESAQAQADTETAGFLAHGAFAALQRFGDLRGGGAAGLLAATAGPAERGTAALNPWTVCLLSRGCLSNGCGESTQTKE
jgi:hypothetical protein